MDLLDGVVQIFDLSEFDVQTGMSAYAFDRCRVGAVLVGRERIKWQK